MTQLQGRRLRTVFVTDGDKKDISPLLLDTYFKELLLPLTAATSCAYKHILAYEIIVDGEEEMALILEDDIFLPRNFENELEKIISEIKSRKMKSFIVSLEDSNLQYIKASERKPGQLLYQKDHGRMAGAYLLDRYAAMNLLEEIQQNRCGLPIDWFHNYASQKKLLTIFWSQHALATQGSLNGSMLSLIDNKPQGLLRRLSFGIQKFYKKVIYRLR